MQKKKKNNNKMKQILALGAVLYAIQMITNIFQI